MLGQFFNIENQGRRSGIGKDGYSHGNRKTVCVYIIICAVGQ